jgi:hypothetical protein
VASPRATAGPLGVTRWRARSRAALDPKMGQKVVGACAVHERPRIRSERGCAEPSGCHHAGVAAVGRRWSTFRLKGWLQPMETSATGPGGTCGAHRGLNGPEAWRSYRTTTEQRRIGDSAPSVRAVAWQREGSRKVGGCSGG